VILRIEEEVSGLNIFVTISEADPSRRAYPY